MTKDEALKLALEFIENSECGTADLEARIKKALAQPKQEPVAWLHRQGNFTEASMNPLHDDEIDRGWTQEPLYTTPPQRTWQGLTDEEIIDVIHPLVMADMADEATDYEIARAIEAKLKEKNT